MKILPLFQFKIAIAIVIVCLVFFPPADIKSEDPDIPARVSPEEFNEAYKRANSLQTVFRTIYERVRPSVVRVVVENRVKVPAAVFPDPFFYRYFGIPQPDNKSNREKIQRAQGSGFIISSDGLIITNAHVVNKAKNVKVALSDGRTVAGTVLGADKLTDIALIKIKKIRNLRATKFGNSDNVHVGDFAIAVGNPFGLDGTFTTGVISAVGRAGLDNSGGKFIQTDASINQGNSGGPLLNLEGKVIGINRMIFSPSGGSVGIGFAIPINEAQAIIKQINEKGEVIRPFLGIEISMLPEDRKKASNGKGIYVRGVLDGSGAHKAGIVPDDIILTVDNKNLEKPDDLIGYIRTKKVGDRVTLKILRNNRRKLVSARLGKR